MNDYFDKIYIINLYDKVARWKKVSSQFKRRGIKVERFIAIDGRCKTQGLSVCKAKAKTFEMSYSVTLNWVGEGYLAKDLYEMIPASSLTIGTVLLLRQQVKNGWKRMLICEDDIELGRKMQEKFKKGIKQLPDTWDLLYLGCGNKCGTSGISWEQNFKHKHLSDYAKFYDDEYYVKYKTDLRTPCDKGCDPVNDYVSIAREPGGTWCYAYSLKGAKKMLKYIDNNCFNHIDSIIKEATKTGKMKAFSFDPPIVMHEGGAIRSDSDIPWKD